MIDEEKINKENRPDYLLFGIASVLFCISLFDVNIAFLIAIISIPTALIILFRRIRDRVKRSPSMYLLSYGGCLLLLISGPSGCVINDYRTEAALKPLISKIEQYYLKNNKYPEQLELLELPSIPMCPDPKRKVIYYISHGDSETFSLTCHTFMYNKHTYNSKTKGWVDQD